MAELNNPLGFSNLLAIAFTSITFKSIRRASGFDNRDNNSKDSDDKPSSQAHQPHPTYFSYQLKAPLGSQYYPNA
jgi:hypothetical protein